MANAKKQEFTTYETFVSAIAVIIVIVEFFIEKTHISAALAGLLIFIVAVRPVTHFKHIAGFRWRERSFIALLLIVVLCWVRSVWTPPLPPTSEIYIQDATLLPFETNSTPKLSLGIFNDSSYLIHYHAESAVSVTKNGIRDTADLERKERELWKGLEDHFREDENNSKFENREFPPKVRTLMTIEGKPLNEAQAKALQTADGSVAVFFLSKFVYSDSAGKHGLENCVFTQGKGAPIRCGIGHNGPMSEVKLHWWN